MIKTTVTIHMMAQKSAGDNGRTDDSLYVVQNQFVEYFDDIRNNFVKFV